MFPGSALVWLVATIMFLVLLVGDAPSNHCVESVPVGLHKHSGRPVLIDYFLKLSFTDNSEALKQDSDGLCSAHVLLGSDKKVGRLAVTYGHEDSSHCKLVFQSPLSPKAKQ
jgi:hypothetical protein